jgi:hypothetical protein
MKTSRFACCLLAAATVILGIGCGATSTGAPPVLPTLPPTPTPQPVHLYLSQGSVYTLPISNASITALTIGSAGLGMALDATHRLVVARPADGTVQVFAAPIVNGATPAFTLSSGLTGANDVAVDLAGDLLIAGYKPMMVCFFRNCRFVNRHQIQFVQAPIASSSVATTMYVGTPVLFVNQSMLAVALDPNGNLWSTNGAKLFEFKPPFGPGATVASIIGEAGVGIAFDSNGNMFVATASGLDVFQPPFSGLMTKAFTINAASASYLAFDPSHNLYVTTTAGQLLIFAQPLRAASTPLITLNVPGGSNSGIAIGP